MRTLFTLLLVFAGLTVAAQHDLSDVTAAPGMYVNGDRPEEGAIFIRENVLWSEDFSNGIPTTWSNTADPELAVWEYRGLLTSPDNSAGTQGSCVSQDDDYGPPIESETADNGFIIFDSNYWDDNIGPCGNFGAGPAPGPHFATLTTDAIDLSASELVGLRFYQYFKNYQANARIEYSIADDEWMILWESDIADFTGETATNDFVRFNVSDQLGGQADVRLRFVFEGNYYHWMIDDIALFELQQNNIIVANATYGDFDFFDQGNETGFEKMEYTRYPAEMAPRVYFSARAANWGAADQTDCNLTAVLRNESTLDTLYEATSASTDLMPDAEHGFTVSAYDLDGTLAPYTTHFHVSQNEEEESPENNTVIHSFDVNDYIYARDQQQTDGVFVPNNVFNGAPYEVGNMFLITADDQAVESVSIGVGSSSWTGASVYAKVYRLQTSGGIGAEEIASTDEFGIIEDALNNVGDNNIMTIPFPEPVVLAKDSAYLVVAGTNDGPENVRFAVSGDSPDFTSYVLFLPNSWFYLVRTPLVRMNFGPVVDVEEIARPEAQLSAYPNPASEHVQLRFNLDRASRCTLVIYDAVGQIVDRRDLGVLPAGEHLERLASSEWADGWYVVSLEGEGFRENEMIVIQH